jgi:putative ABC transport system substrate-binding protein
MNRRAFLAGGAAALGLARVPALAQQAGRVHRVGVLLPLAGLAAQPYLDAARRQLAAHGFVEGRNLQFEIRYGNAPSEARELAALKPDAFFALSTALAHPMHEAAGNAPLVFAWVADPVHAELVQSYARPGGSATGVANRYYELAQKRVELVRELLPAARRVAVAAGSFDYIVTTALDRAQAAAKRLDMTLVRAELGALRILALENALRDGAQAVLMLTPFAAYGMRFLAEEIVRFALERRVPMVFADLETVQQGGLMSYGTDLLADVRQAAELLARVLKGERPADMPVELAARFELAVNLKTARAIGVEVPRSILLRADRVIE